MNKLSLASLEKGLVCLVPKEGLEHTITCHEYSVCDCTVKELISVIRETHSALSFYSQPRTKVIDGSFRVSEEPIELKHDSDYEFYPNHDAAVDAKELLESKIDFTER